MVIINKIELYLVEDSDISCGAYPIEEMIHTAFPDNIIEIKEFKSKDVGDWLRKFEEDGPCLEDLDEEFERGT